MTVSREKYLAKLNDAYAVYFNNAEIEQGIPYLSSCYVFNSIEESYIISKKVKLWSVETHEYVYVFSVDCLTQTILEQCCGYAYEAGMKNIHPHSGHRCSEITALFVCDSILPSVAEKAKSIRKHKDFKFSWHGWMDFKTSVVNLSSGEIATNRAARGMRGFLHGNLEKCRLNIKEDTN